MANDWKEILRESFEILCGLVVTEYKTLQTFYIKKTLYILLNINVCNEKEIDFIVSGKNKYAYLKYEISRFYFQKLHKNTKIILTNYVLFVQHSLKVNY